jgi:hypothetical protein
MLGLYPFLEQREWQLTITTTFLKKKKDAILALFLVKLILISRRVAIPMTLNRYIGIL